MEFEFREVLLVGSHWMVFSARLLYKSHPSAKISLGTCFLRGSWSNSLNCHKEFGIVAISLFHVRTLDKEVFEAFKVPPKWFTRFLLEVHDIFPNESGLINWIEFL